MKIVARIVSVLIVSLVTTAGWGQELELPAQIAAGSELHIRTSGQGSAVLYIVGPGSALKQDVQLGREVTIASEQLQQAGRYAAVLRSGNQSAERGFWVTPAAPAKLAFLARPSRVPVAVAGAVSGVAYVLDAHENLITQPTPVRFELSVDGGGVTRTVTSQNGVAWTRVDSGPRQGAAQFVASVGSVAERRVVQFVASDPCNLHIEAERVKEGIAIKTSPVRDCSGNPVPDGTIVTFTAITSRGRSSVDARIRQGVAATTFPLQEPALISVASGVVLGNEVRVGGAR